jgi:hypothetical protein
MPLALTGEVKDANADAKVPISEMVCGYLGPHQLRPVDVIIPAYYSRNTEAQVAMEMILRDYKRRMQWGFFKRIGLNARPSSEDTP